MKRKLAAVKGFVKRHKVGLAVTCTALTCTYIHVRVINDLNEFLTEHDLIDEYYRPEEEEVV